MRAAKQPLPWHLCPTCQTAFKLSSTQRRRVTDGEQTLEHTYCQPECAKEAIRRWDGLMREVPCRICGATYRADTYARTLWRRSRQLARCPACRTTQKQRPLPPQAQKQRQTVVQRLRAQVWQEIGLPPVTAQARRRRAQAELRSVRG